VSSAASSLNLPLEPLPYHVEIVAHLKRHESDLWQWFSGDRARQQHDESIRLDLLKTTYRIERQSNESLYLLATEAAAAIRLDIPMTIYQAQGAPGLNASLAYTSAGAHIVLHGPVQSALNREEMCALFAHELAHFALYEQWPDYFVASQLLGSMANDDSHHPSHIASGRLFQLYTEVYCDRCSFLATKDIRPTISGLIKLDTEVSDISADSYIRQTREIFQEGHPLTSGITHPETFIRTRALEVWAERPHISDKEIRAIIEGSLSIASLDLLGQQTVLESTRRLIGALLRHKWMRTEAMLAHAGLFFEEFRDDLPAGAATGVDISPSEFGSSDAQLRDYYCYVLLDFAVADRDLEDAPLLAALQLAEKAGIAESFRELAIKELRLKKADLRALESQAQDIMDKAAKEASVT
jgi:hypothetical protein